MPQGNELTMILLRAWVYALVIAVIFYFGYDRLVASGVIIGGNPPSVALCVGLLALLSGVFPEAAAFLYFWIVAFVFIGWHQGMLHANGRPIDAFRFWSIALGMAPLALPFIYKLATGGYRNLFRRDKQEVS